jgi:hypothetical protein
MHPPPPRYGRTAKAPEGYACGGRLGPAPRQRQPVETPGQPIAGRVPVPKAMLPDCTARQRRSGSLRALAGRGLEMVKMIQTRTDPADQGSGMGRVSRTRRLRTTVRNCTRDEGGPFEAGGQVQVSSHRKLLSLRAMVVLCQEGARAPCAGTAHPCSAANAISAAVWWQWCSPPSVGSAWTWLSGG